MLNPVGAATSGERGHTVSARSRAILSAFSRLGYDPMLGKIDRNRRWKSHRKGWGLTGAKASMGGLGSFSEDHPLNL